jgi:hypothetical protein
MAFEAHIGRVGVSRGRHDRTEFRLLRGTLYSVFLTSAVCRRLMPWSWSKAHRLDRRSIFQEARASTDRITPMLFTG